MSSKLFEAFMRANPSFFSPLTTGVKEAPTYSLAEILPQIVAQDKETNGVLI